MILNQIDGKTHIRTDGTKRTIGVFDPSKGKAGTLELKRGGEVCEVDLETLLRSCGYSLTKAS